MSVGAIAVDREVISPVSRCVIGARSLESTWEAYHAHLLGRVQTLEGRSPLGLQMGRVTRAGHRTQAETAGDAVLARQPGREDGFAGSKVYLLLSFMLFGYTSGSSWGLRFLQLGHLATSGDRCVSPK